MPETDRAAPPAPERPSRESPGPAVHPAPPAPPAAPAGEQSDEDVDWLTRSLLTPARPGRRSSIGVPREYARRMSGSYFLAARREDAVESGDSLAEESVSGSEEAEEPTQEVGMYGITPWVTIDTTKGNLWSPGPKRAGISTVTFGNVLAAVFTSPIIVVYALAAGLAALFGCPRLARRLFQLGVYVVWPYGRMLQCDREYVSGKEPRLISDSLLAEYDVSATGADGGVAEGRGERRRRGERKQQMNRSEGRSASAGSSSSSSASAASAAAAAPGAPDSLDTPEDAFRPPRARHFLDDQEEPLVPGISHFPHADPPAPSSVWERIVFYCFCSPLLILSHGLYILVSFLCVVSLPAASLHALVLRKELRDVMVLHPGSVQALASRTPIAVVFRAMSRHSFGQAYFGINVLIINSLSICLVALAFGFMPEEWILENSTLVFVISLIAIVPLSYLIGESISQLTRKTNYAIGALLNATFGSIIEIILYVTALLEGQNKLVQMSLVGSILGCLLLLPGLAMLVGGIRNKEMKINSSLGGVTGLQFICCTLVIFSPTMFYYLYNTPQTTCVGCTYYLSPRHFARGGSYRCDRCQENMWANMLTDAAYTEGARSLQYVSAVILFITYVLGLVFNFVTHSFYYKTDVNLPPELKKLLKEEEKRVHARRQRRMVLGSERPRPFHLRRRRARSDVSTGLPGDVAELLTDKVGEKLEHSLLAGDEEEFAAAGGEGPRDVSRNSTGSDRDLGRDPVTGRRPSKADSLGSLGSHRQKHYSQNPAVPHFTGDEREDIELLEAIAGARREEAVEAYRRLSGMLQIQHRLADPAATPETMSRLSREIIRTEKELVDIVVEAEERAHPRHGSMSSRAGAVPPPRVSGGLRFSHAEDGGDAGGAGEAQGAQNAQNAESAQGATTAAAARDSRTSVQLTSTSLAAEGGSEVEGNPHAGGHVWPMWMVIGVLVLATVMIALISEGLITALDPAIEAMGLSSEFAGLTFFAIVPAMSEYINAAMFAARNHLTLAMEIGRAVTLQTAYIQVPVLILASIFIKTDEPFTILFNIFDFVVVFFAVFLQMVMAENKSHNWYKGAVLLMTYASILGIFFLKPLDELPLPEPAPEPE